MMPSRPGSLLLHYSTVLSPGLLLYVQDGAGDGLNSPTERQSSREHTKRTPDP
jgi:hypothetical protein